MGKKQKKSLSFHKTTHKLTKKWSFPLRISSVNMTKSKKTMDLVPFTEKILSGKIHFCTVPVNSFPKKSQSYMFDTVVNGPLGQVIFWTFADIHIYLFITTYVVVNKSGQSLVSAKNILRFEKGFFSPEITLYT